MSFWQSLHDDVFVIGNKRIHHFFSGFILGIGLIVALAVVYFAQNVSNQGQNYSQASKAQENRSSSTAPRISSYLHTNGTKISDEKGNEILLQGVNDQRMIGGNGKLPQCYTLPTQTQYNNIQSWGFNFVRVAITWANIEPDPPVKNHDGSYTHTWNETYLSQLDNVINEYQNRAVAVILDMHQVSWYPSPTIPAGKDCPDGSGMPTWLYYQDNNHDNKNDLGPGQNQYPRCDFFTGFTQKGVSIAQQDGFVAVWQMLTQRYNNYKNVIGSDILNEPNQPSCPAVTTDMVTSFYNKVGEAIYTIKPKWLLVFARYQDNTTPPPKKAGNWVYTRHIYPTSWGNDGYSDFQQALANSKNWNVPLWLGEFNGHNMPSATKTKDTQKMIDYVHNNNMNWSWFQYDQQSVDALVTGTNEVPQLNLITSLQAIFGLKPTDTPPVQPGKL